MADNVDVKIKAKDETEAGVKKAEGRFAKLGTGITSALGGAGKLALGAAGGVLALGGAAIGTVVKFTEFADEMQKLSARTGEGTEKLSALHYAFSLSDLTAGDLRRTMRRMTERMGQAEKGASALDSILATFNTTLDELPGDSTSEKINRLTASLAEAEVGTSEYQAVLNTLNTTAEEFEELTPEQKIGAISKAVDDMLPKATKFDEGLKNIGLSYQDLEKLSPADQFIAISESISQLETKQQQAAAASDIFGKKLGPDLLVVLESGKEGLEEMAQEAEELGIIIGQDVAEESATFRDNLTKMRNFVTALGNRLGKALLPVLNTLIETALPKMQELLEFIAPGLEKTGEFVTKLATGFLELIGPVLEFVGSGINDIFGNLFGDGDGAEGVTSDFEEIIGKIGELVNSIRLVLGPVINTLGNIFGRVFNFIAEVVGVVFKHIGGVLKSFIDIIIAVVDFVSAIFTGDFSKIFEAAANIVNKVFEFIGNVIRYAVDIIISLIKNLGSGIVKFAIEGFNAFLEIVENVVNGVRNLFFDMVDAVLGIINTMVNGVIDAMLAVVRPIAGTIADIGGFASNLVNTLEGARVDFKVDRGERIEIGRLELPDWVTAAEAAANASAQPILNLAAGAGIPVTRENTIQEININFTGAQFVGGGQELVEAVSDAWTEAVRTGNIRAEAY